MLARKRCRLPEAQLSFAFSHGPEELVISAPRCGAAAPATSGGDQQRACGLPELLPPLRLDKSLETASLAYLTVPHNSKGIYKDLYTTLAYCKGNYQLYGTADLFFV